MTPRESKHILIGSAPSSGSTLLVNLIGRESSMFQCRELSLFDKPDWINSNEAITWKDFKNLGARGYRRRLGCEMSQHLTNFDRNSLPDLRNEKVASYLEHAECVMKHLSEGHDRTRWVEKTPGNIYSFPALLSQRPSWEYVTIVRDPRSVLLSLAKRGVGPALAAARWYLSNLLALQLSRSEYGLMVNYEDLVKKPKLILGVIGAQLNLVGLERVISEAKGDAHTLNTWTASPADPPQKTGLWTADKVLPSGYLEALMRIRPSQKFLDAYGITEKMDAIELSQRLGYDFAWEPFTTPSYRTQLSSIKAYTRYSAALLKRSYVPRSTPFKFRAY